jgi:putative oxidoreductase
MKFIVDFLINGPERLSAWFVWLPPLFARIVVGWVFLWSGWGKLNALDRITQNFVEWGIPFPHIMTPFVSGVEFFGGLLLLLGLFTRVAAVPLVITMIVAILSAKLGDVDSLETLLGFEEMTYFAAFMWLAIAGPGAASLDRLLVNAAGQSDAST